VLVKFTLLDSNIDINLNSKDSNGATGLMLECINNMIKIVASLLKKDVKINLRNITGLTKFVFK